MTELKLGVYFNCSFLSNRSYFIKFSLIQFRAVPRWCTVQIHRCHQSFLLVHLLHLSQSSYNAIQLCILVAYESLLFLVPASVHKVVGHNPFSAHNCHKSLRPPLDLSWCLMPPATGVPRQCMRGHRCQKALAYPTRHSAIPVNEQDTVLRTNLKYANRKILISWFLYYVYIFTHSHIYNAQMT